MSCILEKWRYRDPAISCLALPEEIRMGWGQERPILIRQQLLFQQFICITLTVHGCTQ